MSSGCKSDISVEGRLGALPLPHQFSECGDIAVAFNESWAGANSVDKFLVKTPHLFANRLVMAVDEQGALGVHRVTRDVDFADAVSGKVIQPCGRIVAYVVRPNGDVVHVDEQPAAASTG